MKDEFLILTEQVKSSQFYKEITDEECVIQVNDGVMTRGWYNLVVSIRDLGLYQKGIKPHRYWSINDVKKYFGLKGNKTKMYDQLLRLRDEYKLMTNEPVG